MRKSHLKKSPTPQLPDHLSIEIVDTMERLYAMRKEWLALEQRAKDPLAYFQSFDWCEKWCRIFAPEALSRGGTIHIALIRNGGKLAALLPLAIENRRGLVRVLRFIGEPMIQYAKVLMDGDLLNRQELRLCLDDITHRANCDAIWLDHIVKDSPLHGCLSTEECYQSADAHASAIDLTGFDSGAAYRASLSRSSRKGRNRKRRKLESMGALEFHVIDGKNPDFRHLCEISLKQKAVWLEKSGLPTGKIEDQRMLSMLGELGVDTSGKSGVIAFSLTLDGNPLALEVGFWRNAHYYSYLGSFCWEMRDYSPGKLLLEDAITWSIENGFSVYDLLGNPTPYKEAVANRKFPLVAYAHGKTLIGEAYARYWGPRIKPSLKQTVKSLPIALRQTVFNAAGRYRSK